MSDPKRPIGFPVRLGRVIEEQILGEMIGLPAIAPGRSVDKLTVRSGEACPFCRGDLFDVPSGVIVGRVVGSEAGRVAVDMLPNNLKAVGCPPCGLTFYEPRG